MTKFKRKKNISKKADAILSADLHIRPDVPVGRIDDYFGAMERKIDFILALSKQHECPILVAGDLGNKPLNNGWPVWLLEWTIKKFEGHEIICIAGQHDLPNHRLDLWEKSGIGVLHAAGAIKLIFNPILIKNTFAIFPFHYGQEIEDKTDHGSPNIAMTHQMVIENKPLWPGQEAPKGNSLLKKFPEFSIIHSGDNHLPFTTEHQGRILVNPGSMMRNTADQIDHKPRVYLWWAETNRIEPVYLPSEQDVISREHIKDTTERDNRFDALITRVKTDVEIQLKYEDNVVKYFKKFRTEKAVKDKVLEHVI